MWICIKAIEREIELVGTGDTNKEICDLMYEDMVEEHDSEGELIDAINENEAEFCDSNCYGWSNVGNVNKDWKCFWV